MMQKLKSISTRGITYLVVSLWIACCLAFPVSAQQGQQQQTMPPTGSPPAQITDQQIDRAVEAYQKIQAVHVKFQEIIQGTQDQEEMQQLQQEANQEMIEAVTASGLDVGTYNLVMEQVNSNEDVRERFLKKLNDGIS
jgi:hypothetical protein